MSTPYPGQAQRLGLRRRLSNSSQTLNVMTALTKSITAMLLLLSTAGLHADARAGSAAIETLLKDVVVGHYQAVAEHRLEHAVRFYHSGSPEVARIRAAIELS